MGSRFLKEKRTSGEWLIYNKNIVLLKHSIIHHTNNHSVLFLIYEIFFINRGHILSQLASMFRERGVKYLLDKLETLSSQNAQLRNSIRQRENFNRKLCSENRKRRLKNNQLLQQQNQRLLELKSLKGYQEELRRAVKSLRRALDENQQKLQSYEDDILILQTELKKEKTERLRLEDQNNQLRKKNVKKDAQIEQLNIMQQEIIKRKASTPTGKAPDYENQVIELICKNQQLQIKLEEAQKIGNQYKSQFEATKQQVKTLQQQVDNNKEIISILREEYEQELKDMASSIKTPNQMPKQLPISNVTAKQVVNYQLVTKEPPPSTLRPREKVSLQQYGTRLTLKQDAYFSGFEHLLFSPTSLQNLSFHPITLHHCQQVNLFGNHTWFTRIRLAGEGEVQLGVSSTPYGGVDVMSNRNFVYYSNCSGLIVVDRQGKIIDQYASINDSLTLTVTCLQATTTVRFFKNEKLIYELKVGEQLARTQKLYPFIRLFDFMAVELQ